MRIRAEEVELGDTVTWYGREYKIDGWFLDARGRVIIEFGNRNHVFWRGDRLEIERKHDHPQATV
jgi:hypothetical protein